MSFKDQQSTKVIDTNAILAGKATSGVTITPARPKNTSSSPAAAAIAAMTAAGQKIPSGVKIIQTSRGSPSSSGQVWKTRKIGLRIYLLAAVTVLWQIL